MDQITIPSYRGFEIVVIFESNNKSSLVVYRNHEDATKRFFDYNPSVHDLFGLKEKIDNLMERGVKWRKSIDSSLEQIQRVVSNASVAQYLALSGGYLPH